MLPIHEARSGRRLLLRLAIIATTILTGLSCITLAQQPNPATGSIAGTVVDIDGGLVPGAHVTLTTESSPARQQATTDGQGRFTFSAIPAGKFNLAITAADLAATTFSGNLDEGEAARIPPIILRVATANTDVEVNLSQADLAEAEIKTEEQQRFLGFAPNFFVSYTWHAAPLTTRQKFELADKTVVDPVSFAITAGIAGVEQADNAFSGYKQGVKGYAKRFGASYADFAVGTYLGGAIFPTLFHQDPRYFYKGTGSKRSRALYALSTAVIARGDNGKWQPAYAGILGDMSVGAISNVYYPASDRNGAGLTIENGLLSVASDGVGNLLQEFVWRHLTSGIQKSSKTKP